VNVTVPLNFGDEACYQSFGEEGATFQKLGRSNVSAVLKFSANRAKPKKDVTYKPMSCPRRIRSAASTAPSR